MAVGWGQGKAGWGWRAEAGWGREAEAGASGRAASGCSAQTAAVAEEAMEVGWGQEEAGWGWRAAAGWGLVEKTSVAGGMPCDGKHKWILEVGWRASLWNERWSWQASAGRQASVAAARCAGETGEEAGLVALVSRLASLG
jgi:hypothetical protein